MAGVEECALLITSRLCRFHALSTETQKIFRRLKVDGIKNVQELAECILKKKMGDPDPKRSCDLFNSQVRKNNMSKLMETPLMLINALRLWENDKSLHTSKCINYIKMIHLFVYQAKGEQCWPSSKNRLR